jgi:hypothetical protein
MVFPGVQALDNPLILMDIIKTPEGRKAAAVMLTQAGVTPEKFITKVSQAASSPERDQQALQAPTGKDLADEVGQEGIQPPKGESSMPIPVGMGSLGSSIAGAGGGGAAAGSFNPAMLGTALQGVQAIQPPQTNVQVPGAVAPNQGNPSGLNPMTIQQLIQLALGGQAAPTVPPSLGQLFAQGGIR